MIKFFLVLVVLSGIHGTICHAQRYPGKHWNEYVNPKEAGFSPQKLEVLKHKFQLLDGEALLVIHNGAILLREGPLDRRFRQTSVRKSYLSALVGIYLDKGTLDLQSTLESLGITDNERLTKKESSARLLDLMRTSSGIYLPSAYSLVRLPERGSKQIGQHWEYNNWDFNAVGAIFNKRVPMDVFEAFQHHLAKPLKMEDFRMTDTFYRYEKDKSKYPAYLFRLSARDMARFGWLFAKEGKWKNDQVLPKWWVYESTRAHTTKLGPGFSKRGGYGLMWWVNEDFHGEPMFFASGAGGQRIIVFPKSDLVLIHLTDNYQPRNVSENEIQEMCRLLLDAKQGNPIRKPQLSKLKLPGTPKNNFRASMDKLLQYVGIYNHPKLGPFSVILADHNLMLKTGIGYFHFQATSDSTFYNRDIGQGLLFKTGTEELKGKIAPEMNAEGTITQLIFYYQ